MRSKPPCLSSCSHGAAASPGILGATRCEVVDNRGVAACALYCLPILSMLAITLTSLCPPRQPTATTSGPCRAASRLYRPSYIVLCADTPSSLRQTPQAPPRPPNPRLLPLTHHPKPPLRAARYISAGAEHYGRKPHKRERVGFTRIPLLVSCFLANIGPHMLALGPSQGGSYSLSTPPAHRSSS